MHNDGKVKAFIYKIASIIPDKMFLTLKFVKNFHRFPNWKNPRTFNEKLNWLKLYNRNPLYTIMVDKYEAKEFFKKKIGEKYIIPTLGVWDKADDIDFESLPNQFVLKATHDSGRVIICKDKSKLDFKKAKLEMKLSLERDFYAVTREWPYKNVKRRIIAEKLMTDSSVQNRGGLTDYKISCFNGNAYKVMLCIDRDSGNTKFYSFDKEWNLLRHNKMGIEAPVDFTLPKPEGIDEMFELAERLSKDVPFARVDFYYVNNQIYFGEFTLYPMSGFDANIIPDIDILYGSMIKLPNKNKF